MSARFFGCCALGAMLAHAVVAFICWDWNPGHWAGDMRIITITMLAPAFAGLLFMAPELKRR